MSSTIRGWTTLADQPLVLVHEYSFGAGRANAMAVGLPGGKLLLVSPPTNVPRAVLDDLRSAGEVVALVANNGTHHLGLAASRAAFPSAVTYAAPAAAARIRTKNREAGQLAPVEALQPLLGDKVKPLSVDASKVGDVIVTVQTEKGALFYSSDFIANIQRPPSNPLFRLAFRLTKSGPGLRVFGIFFNSTSGIARPLATSCSASSKLMPRPRSCPRTATSSHDPIWGRRSCRCCAQRGRASALSR